MYNKTQIRSCFEHLVGWHGSQACGETSLTADLLQSDSDLFVDDLPGVTWPVILDTLEDWHGGLNAYLTKVMESELYTMLDQFVANNKQEYISKQLMANQPLFSGDVDFADIVTQTESFQGFILKARESNNLITELKQIGLQISGAQTLRIFLYDTAQKQALKTYDFSYTMAGSEVWKDMTDFIINYQTLTGGMGRTFLVGYYESNSAHPESWQLSSRLNAYYADFCCDGCNLKARKVWQRWISCQPVTIPASELNWNVDTFDLPNMTNLLNGSYRSTRSAGMNAKVNITCDITQPICHNKMMFDQVYQIKIALRVLEDAMSTSRFNSTSETIQNQCARFIEKYTGILEGTIKGYQIGDDVKFKSKRGLIDMLSMDFSNIDAVCLKKKAEVEMGKQGLNRGSSYSYGEFTEEIF